MTWRPRGWCAGIRLPPASGASVPRPYCRRLAAGLHPIPARSRTQTNAPARSPWIAQWNPRPYPTAGCHARSSDRRRVTQATKRTLSHRCRACPLHDICTLERNLALHHRPNANDHHDRRWDDTRVIRSARPRVSQGGERISDRDAGRGTAEHLALDLGTGRETLRREAPVFLKGWPRGARSVGGFTIRNAVNAMCI